MPPNPRVFISYSHDAPEHMDRVLTLADRLRRDGVDCYIDQYEPLPQEGWPRWSGNQIEQADFILVVCSLQYSNRFKGVEETGIGLGVKWEGAIITQGLYDAEASNTKFIPVSFSSEEWKYIPSPLRGASRFELDKDYDALYRILTDQPAIVRPELGKLRPMPPLERQSGTPPSGTTPSEKDNEWLPPQMSSGLLTRTEGSGVWSSASITATKSTKYVSAFQPGKQPSSPTNLWESTARTTGPLQRPTSLVELGEDSMMIGRDDHWDRDEATRDFLLMITQQKTGDDKKDKQHVLVLQGREVGLDSLVDRFEKMCEKVTTTTPLIYAKINLGPIFSDYYGLALQMVDRLRRCAKRRTLTDEWTKLTKAYDYVEEIQSKTGYEVPSPLQFARRFTEEHLANVTLNCTVVLLLQGFDLLKESSTSAWLSTSTWLKNTWLAQHAGDEEGLVVLLTGEEGLEDLKGQQFVSYHHLPPLNQEKLREWATQSQRYGFNWFTDEDAKTAHEICNGNPEKFRKLLDYTKGLLKIGPATPQDKQ